MKSTVLLLLLVSTISSQAQETRSQLIERINTYEGISLDKFGNLEVDRGSASAGRFNVDLNSIGSIKLELRGEEKGCADYCPARCLIWFECADGPCAWDPVIGRENKYSTAVITGDFEIYLTLIKFKYFDFIDISDFTDGK